MIQPLTFQDRPVCPDCLKACTSCRSERSGKHTWTHGAAHWLPCLEHERPHPPTPGPESTHGYCGPCGQTRPLSWNRISKRYMCTFCGEDPESARRKYPFQSDPPADPNDPH